MSDYDLTEAVEAAARAAADHPAFTGGAHPNDGMMMWDSLRPEVQHLLRELVLPLVAAAVPFIVEAEVADECAHTALSLIYRQERDEARAEYDSLRVEWGELVEALAEATNTLVCAESCAGQSWTGVDQAEGPDKVWRCDTCGRIISQSVSNPS